MSASELKISAKKVVNIKSILTQNKSWPYLFLDFFILHNNNLVFLFINRFLVCFVHPAYIKGTLQKGFELYKSLPLGIARGIFMIFFASNIHPFNDGNGRISRIMMNAELYNQGLAIIIILNVYRSDYLSNLKALSRRADPVDYTRMLSIAHEFSAIDFTDYQIIKNLIESKNWFRESDETKIIS